ncbi:hypothetical protein EIP91_008535 [Steccherinum ochraceum]|uniref:G-protein coupled receptors family 1 profile domain-containing protein n=1 Tax=Steccherinum ochraceum TaxID=92696 RepID=A0A4R0R2R6_9APHY|nr:hypothetical protein EIP91_008535 [Steccherinum ochraceum]
MLCVLCLLFAIDRISSPINCKVVHPVLTTLGLVASACATTNLMIRTVIIWNYHKWIMIPLALVSCGQFFFSLYAGTTYAVAYWDKTLRTCLFQYEHYSHMASVFIYTVSYDLIILILTYIRIRSNTRSQLLPALRKQGILYFVFTSIVNTVAAVIIWLHLNDGMNAVATPPATTISVILSSQSVISLMRLNNSHGGTDTPSSARRNDRELFTKRRSQQLTTQIDFPTAIYGNNSFDVSRGFGGPSLSQSPMSSVGNLETSSSPSLPMPVASSSKLKL